MDLREIAQPVWQELSEFEVWEKTLRRLAIIFSWQVPLLPHWQEKNRKWPRTAVWR
jgi:hypothetical protein